MIRKVIPQACHGLPALAEVAAVTRDPSCRFFSRATACPLWQGLWHVKP
jgi:hypothetical protein